MKSIPGFEFTSLFEPRGATSPVASPVATPPATRADALAALNGPLKHFIGGSQRAVLVHNLRGEERQYFYDLLTDFARRIEAMPKTYETEGQGREVIAHLHYFAGGQANFYITEKDQGSPGDEGFGSPGGSPQYQATGQADLYDDGGEYGYISIAEILANNGELDFHWKPKPLNEIYP